MSQSGQRLQDEGNRLQVITAGAVSGLISRFIVAPLDVVKIRLQLQSHSLSDPLSYRNLQGSPVYKGTIPTIQHIFRNEGITGLWKGNLSAELMYVAYGAVQFSTYRHIPMLLHSVFGDKTIPKSVESFAAGAGAGATATAVTYPFDLLRTRFAAQGNDRIYSGFLQAIRDIRRDEGIKGFFRGLGPGLAQIVPYMGIVFSIYEYLRVPARKLELPFGTGEFAAGVIASIVAKTGVFPLDLVRKRIQVQGPTRSRYVHKNIPLYERGTVNALKTILATEGVRGLYRGLTVSLIKAAPTSALSICTYEAALRLLIRKEKDEEEALS